MEFYLSSRFKKSLRKRPGRIQNCAIERMELFKNDRMHPLLDDHPLGGELLGMRSFSVGGDLRVQYEHLSEGAVYLVDIGTHSELYS